MLAIKLADLEKRPFNAKERVKWQKKVARHASKAAGLIEQAESVKTEYDAINALANFEANYYTKSHGILVEWHKALDITQFESVRTICENDFLYSQPFTVGDYLETVEKLKSETYADRARRIGDFWEFSFTLEDDPKVAQKKTPFKRRAQTVNLSQI